MKIGTLLFCETNWFTPRDGCSRFSSTDHLHSIQMKASGPNAPISLIPTLDCQNKGKGKVLIQSKTLRPFIKCSSVNIDTKSNSF